MKKDLKKFKPRLFRDPHKALEAIIEVYEANVEYLRLSFEEFASGQHPPSKVRGFYPYVKIDVKHSARTDSRLSYGFGPKNGVFYTTVTRPSDIYGAYLKEQIRLLLMNHDESVEIGVSDSPIPLHFALGEEYHLEKDLDPEQLETLSTYFDQPDLGDLDDEIANCTYIPGPGEPMPLSLFGAGR